MFPLLLCPLAILLQDRWPFDGWVVRSVAGFGNATSIAIERVLKFGCNAIDELISLREFDHVGMICVYLYCRGWVKNITQTSCRLRRHENFSRSRSLVFPAGPLLMSFNTQVLFQGKEVIYGKDVPLQWESSWFHKPKEDSFFGDVRFPKTALLVS